MKTIKQATDEIMALKTLGIGSIEPSVSETIRDVALEHYRAGMEAAAKLADDTGDNIGVGKTELTDREDAFQDGCYSAGAEIYNAAKTAQLP